LSGWSAGDDFVRRRAQRVKLRRNVAPLDRPHALHPRRADHGPSSSHDVAQLLDVLHELVDQGNTMIVIGAQSGSGENRRLGHRHGPEGGDGGGEVVAEGPPEQIARYAKSYTGQYLQAGAG